MVRVMISMLALAMALTACGQADGEWTQDVRDNFMSECLPSSGGEEEYCLCVLEQLEDTYTLEEFETIEQELIETDTMPAELEEMIDGCIQEHLL